MIDPVSFGIGAFLVWGIWVVSVAVREYPKYKKEIRSGEHKTRSKNV